MSPFLLGFVLSSAMVVLAYYKEALSSTGAIVAFILGTLIYGLLGFYAFFILLSFFLLSFMIRFFHEQSTIKERNAIQVFAIGGLASLCAILYGVYEAEIFKILFIGAIAAAAADALSSEIGQFSKNQPFSILTLKPMDKGLSGAISPLGLLFGFLAALFYSVLSIFFVGSTFVALLILIIAFFNSLFDSILGLIQVKYRYPNEETLYDTKKDGMIIGSGISWLNNHIVNGVSNLISLGLLVILYLLLIY